MGVIRRDCPDENAAWVEYRARNFAWYTRHLTFAHLSDDELVAQLLGCSFDMRRLKARVLLMLGEIEERKIYLLAAASSMWDYARRFLLMSHGSAHRFIAVARLCRRYPWLAPRIESGELHMTTLSNIASFLTDENVRELVDETAGEKRAEVDLVLVRRFGVDRSSQTMPYDEELLRLLEIANVAYTVLIAHLEKKKRAKAEQPRPAPTEPTKSISRHATREMFERDGDQCTYVDERSGARCPSRAFIQREHHEMRCHGGDDDPKNLRPMCGPHNLLLAEQALRRDYVQSRIR